MQWQRTTDPPTPMTKKTIEVPIWVQVVQGVPGFIACVLLIMYLFNQVKCEKFVNIVIITNVGACAIFCLWFLASGAYKEEPV